jgi:hypothetical protein
MKRPEILIDVCRRSSGDSLEYRLVEWIDHLESRAADPLFVDAGNKCPMCGMDAVHVHSAIEQTIYRNGIKAGNSQSAKGNG